MMLAPGMSCRNSLAEAVGIESRNHNEVAEKAVTVPRRTRDHEPNRRMVIADA